MKERGREGIGGGGLRSLNGCFGVRKHSTGNPGLASSACHGQTLERASLTARTGFSPLTRRVYHSAHRKKARFPQGANGQHHRENSRHFCAARPPKSGSWGRLVTLDCLVADLDVAVPILVSKPLILSLGSVSANSGQLSLASMMVSKG